MGHAPCRCVSKELAAFITAAQPSALINNFISSLLRGAIKRGAIINNAHLP
jgi:hypothetical protein